MNFLPNHFIVVIFLFMGELIFAQKKYSDYYILQQQYENRRENDSTALPLVRKYIKKAKREKEYDKLILGYKDALYLTPNPYEKLKYADSVVCIAILTKDNQLVSDGYMNKGVVYYFNLKKYKLALTEYLKAYEYCKDNNNLYHKNRLRYLIGVVKSYCGYYEEALTEFKHTRAFFESEYKKDIHPNLVFNNRRGYYNSLHQMAVCYRNLGNIKKADSIVYFGLGGTMNSSDYKQEHGYFLKEKGISDFNREEYGKSIRTLIASLQEMSDVNDFAWTTVCYSYLGKSYMQLGDVDLAISYFKKVDSVFARHNFILPEVLNNYGTLIDYYKKKRNIYQEFYYTKRLLKADSIIGKDFTYLSSKIHRDYDARKLQEEKLRLEERSSYRAWIIVLLIIVAIVLLIIVFVKCITERKIRQNYYLIEQKILSSEYTAIKKVEPERHSERPDFEQAKVNEILAKLEDFEAHHKYLESGLTINKLAEKFGTNRSYLSQVINDYRAMNFNRYLAVLRIGYITNKLYNDKKYLHYKIETLAEECGIASRSNFSRLFKEINEIRPTDFIKKRQLDNEREQAEQS